MIFDLLTRVYISWATRHRDSSIGGVPANMLSIVYANLHGIISSQKSPYP